MFHLPLELITIILDYICLIPVTYSPRIEDNPPWEEDGYNSRRKVLFENYTGSVRQPVDEPIIAWEATQAAFNLSATCWRARKLLAPRLFRSIHLTTAEHNVESVLAVSQSWLREFVVDLRYQAFAPRGEGGYLLDRSGEEIEPDDDADCFWENPPELDGAEPEIDYNDPGSGTDAFSFKLGQVLANLSRFPNLKNLFIETDDLFEAFDVYMLAEMFKCRRDSDWPVYELIAKSFDAISQNPPGTFISLQLPHYALLDVEVFEQPRWHRILAELKEFSFSWPAWHNDKGTLHGEGALDTNYVIQNFYCHLKAVENFTTEANEVCVFGDTSEHGDQWQLTPGVKPDFHERGTHSPGYEPPLPPEMPWLRRVRFVWMMLDNELTSFILNRAEQLEIIELSFCISLFVAWQVGGPDADEQESMWLTFLDSLAKKEPKKLRSFELPSLAEWNEMDRLDIKGRHPTFTPEQVEVAVRARERDDRYFLFGDRAYQGGWLDLNNERIMVSIATCEEQRAYERLMQIVKGNARYAASMTMME